MAQIVLQPCGTGLPAKHYEDTVQNPVPISKMIPFLASQEIAELRQKFPHSAAVWGVTRGETSLGELKWRRMNPGDVALFSRTGRIFSRGIVTMKIHNPRLAQDLWGVHEDGKTWEYMYFLRDINSLDIPYERFNTAAGYAKNFVIQGFNVLPPDRSLGILDLLGMSFAHTPNEDELARQQRIADEMGEFNAESDGEGRRKTLAAICRRQGQPEFRRKLIEAYSGRCAISGCNAVQTLEAAHIIQYDGPKTNHPANGLLLRADLHVLFDLGLIAIDPHTFKVRIAPALKDTMYAEYEGKDIEQPLEERLKPSAVALSKRWSEELA
jgi:hypothetical protein